MDEKEVLKENLVELRRSFDQVNVTYEQLRTKALAFIAGEVALVTFLFATEIRFPIAPYGMILFTASVLALIAAFCLLLWTIATVQWKIPCDFNTSAELKDKYATELDLLRYTNDDYAKVIRYCLSIVDKKAKRFNWTLYLLLAGVIMIILIKYGGPQL